MSTNKRHQKNLEFLFAVAKDTAPVSGYRLAACIVYRGLVVAVGTNSYKSHPLARKYGKNADAIYLHAELAAIRHASYLISVENMKYATLYVARARKDPNVRTVIKGVRKDVWGNAKPCKGCRNAIIAFGLKKVIYTLDDSGYETL